MGKEEEEEKEDTALQGTSRAARQDCHLRMRGRNYDPLVALRESRTHPRDHGTRHGDTRNMKKWSSSRRKSEARGARTLVHHPRELGAIRPLGKGTSELGAHRFGPTGRPKAEPSRFRVRSLERPRAPQGSPIGPPFVGRVPTVQEKLPIPDGPLGHPTEFNGLTAD